jgi:hypothetical protein
LWVVFAWGDLGRGYKDLLLEPDWWLEQVLRGHDRRGWFMAQPELGKAINCLIVSLKDMVELETVELFLQLPNLLPVCSHVGVTTIRLSHNLIDNELSVSMDIKPLNPKFSGDVQTVDQCLILPHNVGGMEV